MSAEGLVLGKGPVVAPWRSGAVGYELALAGREDAIAALLSIAGLRPVEADIVWKFAAMARALLQGEKALAAIALTQAGLPEIANEESAEALSMAAETLSRGVDPADLMKSLIFEGFLQITSKPFEFDKFNPNHDERGRFSTAQITAIVKKPQFVSETGAAHQNTRAVRGRVASLAEHLVYSTAWAQDTSRGDFGSGTDKCNLFVYEVLKQAGAD